MATTKHKHGPEPAESVLSRLRVSLIRSATLHVGGQPEETLMLDLGLEGIFIERGASLARGTSVRLRFTLPGNERPVDVAARVAWCNVAGPERLCARRPAGLGLEFARISPSDRQRLRSLLLEHYRRPPRARQFAPPWPVPGAPDRQGDE